MMSAEGHCGDIVQAVFDMQMLRHLPIEGQVPALCGSEYAFHDRRP